MTLRVPTSKAAGVGMRKLAAGEVVSKALVTLTGRARVKLFEFDSQDNVNTSL